MLSHGNILAVVAGQLDGLNQACALFNQKFTEDDVFLSYLPLAHIFDRAIEEMFLAFGARIGYWRGTIPFVLEDIQVERPVLSKDAYHAIRHNTISWAHATAVCLQSTSAGQSSGVVSVQSHPCHEAPDCMLNVSLRAGAAPNDVHWCAACF